MELSILRHDRQIYLLLINEKKRKDIEKIKSKKSQVKEAMTIKPAQIKLSWKDQNRRKETGVASKWWKTYIEV